MIPAEAVEAAAKAMAELGEFDNGECQWPDFALVAIAAAAPYMMTERGEWRKGESGWE